MELIDETFRKEKGEEEQKNWEQKLKKENITVHIKKNGSEYNKDQPFSFSEFEFNENYPLEKLLKSVPLPHS